MAPQSLGHFERAGTARQNDGHYGVWQHRARNRADCANTDFIMRVVAMRRTMQTPRRRYNETGVGDPEGRIPEKWYAAGRN